MSPDESAADPAVLRRTPEELRAAVYRAGATEADRAALDAALRDAAAGTDDGPSRPAALGPARMRRGGRRSASRRVLAAAGVALALLVAGGWLARATVPRERAPRPTASAVPQVRSTPVALLGDVEDRHRQQFALVHLFDDIGAADLRTYLIRYQFGAAFEPRRVLASVRGHGTGHVVVDLGGLPASGGSARILTVLLTCERSASYRWSLTSPGPEHDDPTAITTSGPQCAGAVIAASVRPRRGQMPTRLEVTVPDGVRAVASVLLSSSG